MSDYIKDELSEYLPDKVIQSLLSKNPEMTVQELDKTKDSTLLELRDIGPKSVRLIRQAVQAHLAVEEGSYVVSPSENFILPIEKEREISEEEVIEKGVGLAASSTLRWNGINSLNQLRNMTDQEILDIKYIGPESLRKIRGIR